MNHPNTPGAASGSTDPDGLPEDLLAELGLTSTEVESLESAMRLSREEDVVEAVQELENADLGDPNTRQFVDSVKALSLIHI